MRPPCEIVVRRLLPVLRTLVAQELMESYEWTQNQIAECLGVTQPAVSGYLSLFGKGVTRKFNVEEVKVAAKNIATGLATREPSTSEAICSLCELCIKLKCGGVLCTVHKSLVPELSKEGCEICLHLYARGMEPLAERYEVLTNIRKAVSMIEECEAFADVMPEVRVNVVMATSTAKTIAEIAGIPGRIVKVRSQAKAFMDPEFGASFHMANILLTVMKKNKKVRAMTNIIFDNVVEAVVKRLGLNISQFDRTEFPEDVLKGDIPAVWGVEKCIEKLSVVPDVIVDKGGYGIEPVAYIFGISAVDAVKKAILIAETVHTGCDQRISGCAFGASSGDYIKSHDT